MLSLCGCREQSPNDGILENVPAQSTSEDTQSSASQLETDIIRPVTEAPLPAVRETDDTRLAVDFIRDFYKMLINRDESALDLDKYFNEGELKERMARCKEQLLKDDMLEKDYFAFDYVIPVSNKATDEANMITVDYSYHFRYSNEPYDPENPNDGWSGSGMRAPFAIKDGKIVNLAVEGHFKPLPADENIPDVQIIISHITAVENGSFELDGIVFKKENSERDIVIEDGAFIKLVTPDGLIDPNDYDGEPDELIAALKNIFELKNLGNTGRLEVDEVVFDDATIYQLGEKLLVVGKMSTSDDVDTTVTTYCKAMIFSSV